MGQNSDANTGAAPDVGVTARNAVAAAVFASSTQFCTTCSKACEWAGWVQEQVHAVATPSPDGPHTLFAHGCLLHDR